MSATFGTHLRLTLFGESHGAGIGITVDGLPPGFSPDFEQIRRHMQRRAPGRDPTATARKEADEVRILSGLYQGHTTGAALTGFIENTNVRSGDYAFHGCMRPGHADYPAFVRYDGASDPRGGGPFSGRLTAPLVFAGSLCRQLLSEKGIAIAAHISAIAEVEDAPLPLLPEGDLLSRLNSSSFPLVDEGKEVLMRQVVAQARAEGDSVGGRIECVAVGVPAGVGSPFFRSVESVLSSLAFSVPAVKAVIFGDGLEMTTLRGSQANDCPRYVQGDITHVSNHNGGITGGITNGMPVRFTVCIKPTPSISRPQQTINVLTGANEDLSIRGRHDPCIVPRAAVVMESITAIGLLDLMLDPDNHFSFVRKEQS